MNKKKKFDYKDLANYLLDCLFDVYEPHELLKMLVRATYENDFLEELGFDYDDIEATKEELKDEE